MIRGVVFDMDHTIYDRHASMLKVSDDFLKVFGKYLDMAAVGREEAFLKLLEADDRYVYSGWRAIYQHLLDSLPFSERPDFQVYVDFYCRYFPRCVTPYPYTYSLLLGLREQKYKLGLITNGMSANQNIKIDTLGFREYFDHIIVASEVGHEKPHPKPFILMAERLNLQPEEMLFVGDNPICDVVGSRGVGYVPVWIDALCAWPEYITKPEHVIHSLDQLDGLLAAMKKRGE